MGRKDHQETIEEANRKRNRDIKRVTSTAYQAAPPVLTRGIDAIGASLKTSGQVGDVTFPILFFIDDRTDAALGTLNYDLILSEPDAHFHRLTLNDNGGAITNFNIFFLNLPKNKELQFTLVIDTIFSGTPTVTFDPVVNDLPAGFPTGSTPYYLLISAINTPVLERYQVLNSSAASGSPLTTKGDIFGFNTVDARIPVSGTDGFVLTEDSTDPLGVAWKVTGAASQTPIGQDIVYAGFDIRDISNIEFRTTTGAPADSVQAMWADANGIIINVPTGDDLNFRENGTNFFVADEAVTFLSSNTTSINSAIVNLGIVSTSNINFVGRINTDIRIDSAHMIKSQDSAEIGFLVTDDSGSTGSKGTIQMPTNTSAPGTASNANGLWGAFFGAFGYYDPGSGVTAFLYIKQANGDWSVFLGTRGALV